MDTRNYEGAIFPYLIPDPILKEGKTSPANILHNDAMRERILADALDRFIDFFDELRAQARAFAFVPVGRLFNIGSGENG